MAVVGIETGGGIERSFVNSFVILYALFVSLLAHVNQIFISHFRIL